MAAAFKTRGCSLPPWRTRNAVLSKWDPASSRSIPVYAGCSIPSAAARAHAVSGAKHTQPACCNSDVQHRRALPLPATGAAQHDSRDKSASLVGVLPAVSPPRSSAMPWRVQTGFQVSDVVKPLRPAEKHCTATQCAAPPAAVAFDMWSHRPLSALSDFQTKARLGRAPQVSRTERLSGCMLPVCTVKMSGRSRA